MKLYIYTDYKNKDTYFESSRIRKNIKGLLELSNESYVNQNATTFYKVAQYFKLSDVSSFDLEVKYKKINNGICLFYNECEQDDGIFFKDKDEFVINKVTIDKINKFDFAFVPSELSKDYLRKLGVYCAIYVLNPSVKYSKFDFTTSIIKDVFYRICGINKGSKLFVSVIRDEDEEAIKKITLIANKFKDYKYIVLSEHKYLNQVKKNNKYFSKWTKNVMYMPLLDEDAYVSLLYNADIFININSYPSNFIESMECMASKTQIFSLSQSTFKDFLVDKENAYIYNDLESLTNGIEDYNNQILKSLKDEAYEYAKKYSLTNYGSYLIKIYKEIEEVEK